MPLPSAPHGTPTHDNWPSPGYGTVLSPDNYDYSDASITNRVAWLELELAYLRQRICWLENEVKPYLYTNVSETEHSCVPSRVEGQVNHADDLDAFMDKFINGDYHE